MNNIDLTPVYELIKQLSARIDMLEKGNVNWIALWVGIGSIIVSVLALVFTIINNSKNNKRSDTVRKESNLASVVASIDAAKLNAQSMAMQVASIDDSPENIEIKRDQINASLELVLNKYEGGCEAFYKSKIERQDFVDKYDEDIRRYIEQYPEKFTGPLVSYKYMLKYFDEYHKNKKAT